MSPRRNTTIVVREPVPTGEMPTSPGIARRSGPAARRQASERSKGVQVGLVIDHRTTIAIVAILVAAYCLLRLVH